MLDLRSGYLQVEVDVRDREKMAFCTPERLLEFNVMPLGYVMFLPPSNSLWTQSLWPSLERLLSLHR